LYVLFLFFVVFHFLCLGSLVCRGLGSLHLGFALCSRQEDSYFCVCVVRGFPAGRCNVIAGRRASRAWSGAVPASPVAALVALLVRRVKRCRLTRLCSGWSWKRLSLFHGCGGSRCFFSYFSPPSTFYNRVSEQQWNNNPPARQGLLSLTSKYHRGYCLVFLLFQGGSGNSTAIRPFL
jgi:hypothetical protein